MVKDCRELGMSHEKNESTPDITFLFFFYNFNLSFCEENKMKMYIQ